LLSSVLGQKTERAPQNPHFGGLSVFPFYNNTIILDDDCLHVPGLHFLHHGGESGAVEPGSGDSIVREMGRVGETVAAGAIFQHGFLVADGIGLGCGQSFRC
jgi:hypothetical protein